MRRQKNTIKCSCSCPYFLDHFDPCKHIWATLLAAEARGLLRGTGGGGPVSLEVDAEDLDEDGDDQEVSPSPRNYPPSRPRQRAQPKRNWKRQLEALRRDMEARESSRKTTWQADREILYVVDVEATVAGSGLLVEVAARTRKKDGGWSMKLQTVRLDRSQFAGLPDPDDRRLLALLAGAREQSSYGMWSSYSYAQGPSRFELTSPLAETLIPQLCQTGRCCLRRKRDDTDLRPLQWDDGPPWEFGLRLAQPQKGEYLLRGELWRGTEALPLSAPVLLLAGGLMFLEDRVARLQDFGAFSWITLLRREGDLSVPAQQKEELLKSLLQLPQVPRLNLPLELQFEEVPGTPQPHLKVLAPQEKTWGQPRLRGELSFAYDGIVVPAEPPGRGVYQPEQRRFLLRDAAAENAARARLPQLGFKKVQFYGRSPQWELTPRNLPSVVRTLLPDGWHVEAEGKIYRQPNDFHIEVLSGIDWFELHGGVSYGDQPASLPALLAAVQRGENLVELGDGTFGLLPEDWLRKFGLLAGLGTREDDHLRFGRSQVGLLDALLAAQPEATCDAVFTQARNELAHFQGIEALDPPPGFVGALRGYQRDGLGWFHFLKRFGFGGCLADDMGLGKTVMVLALLESGRPARQKKKDAPPSLVVVPRSLVFNWEQEARRFTPQLRLLAHTGIDRRKPGEHFADYDVILTTYGTLRRDALEFKEVDFEWCILDEAQAVKNSKTESAKAVRLVQARHRLALSGTPVENHLGELWSLFDFLNPGMLGTTSAFRLDSFRNPDPETRQLLAKALRPFILRRTKAQVARDLPAKVEQTIYCDLEADQRRLYDELREHYRQSLLGRAEREGMKKVKLQVLTALLRLRQAACHPGLLDPKKKMGPSAKLDLLLEQLEEVCAGGHKALVFSQFTTLLSIVRARLDQTKVPYVYLDGRTRDRAARVEEFQTDPDKQLFLISLKAGGLGLNLTAAEYVFLLDPWWNPAVEAQAIDRTHRIGQDKQVFAYRLIARDTVEEKVLELQKTKRDLADAIINADNSLIRNLGREELELLLS